MPTNPFRRRRRDDPPLWEERHRRPLTARNVYRDVRDTTDDVRDEPEEVEYRIRQRFWDYFDQGGPDINQPVPLTPNPYRRRRE